jgi:hypothetical protein
MRAFSHHLALCMPNEVHCEWHMLPVNTQGFCLNLLLLPWPKSVRPAQFQPAPGPNPTIHHGSHEMFTLHDSDFDDSDVKKLRAVLKAASERVGRIDGVVLPELALGNGTSRAGQECRARQRFLSNLGRRLTLYKEKSWHELCCARHPDCRPRLSDEHTGGQTPQMEADEVPDSPIRPEHPSQSGSVMVGAHLHCRAATCLRCNETMASSVGARVRGSRSPGPCRRHPSCRRAKFGRVDSDGWPTANRSMVGSIRNCACGRPRMFGSVPH